MSLLNKIKISFFVLLCLLFLLNVKSFAVTGTVTEITVNVREKASTNSKRVMYVTQDDEVEVLEKNGEWYKIKYKNKTGYILGKYIKVDNSKLNEEKQESNQQQQEEIINPEEDETVETNTNQTYQINENTQIRIIPNISSSVIYTAKKNININIIEQIEDWAYISVENIIGWIRTDKIIEESNNKTDENKSTSDVDNATTKKDEEDTNQKEEIAYIKYDTVNLREKSSTDSKSLAKLKLNEEVTILEKTNSVWCKVKYDDKIGYISVDLLSDKKQKEQSNDNTTSRSGETISREKETKTETKETTISNTVKEEKETTSNKVSNKVTGSDIVSYAKQYLGYNYVYGGASPKTGFDCSGFTYYVYKHFGYTLSRSSVAQANNGTKVDKKDLQPGDLVIYKNTSLTKIGHVGIYIGDNKMIHASEPGVGVVITYINSASHNYPKRYVMGRRIL